MKQHPIVIETSYELDSGPLLGYYSKGHHAPDDFLAALEAGWEVVLQPTDVHHQYWRFVPAMDYDNPPPMAIQRVKGPGRGAFPVTYAEVHT